MAAAFSLADLPPWAFDKEDPGDDATSTPRPRLVTHIDDGAIAALTGFYRAQLPAGGAICDLMSSWVSHLPDDVGYGEVIGHGMNAEELAANPQLTRWFVQDLNADPGLPLESASLDAAMICVGVQYLQRRAGAGRRAPRAEAGRAADRQLLQPLLPHQGGRGLAAPGRRAATPRWCGSTWRRRGSPTLRPTY